MDIPIVPLTAARNLAFVYTAGLLGEDDAAFDLTGCTLKMEVRQYGAQPGAALISLAQVTTDVQGVRVLNATDGTICIRINQAALAALPGGPAQGSEPNAPDTFVYDLVITRPALAEPLALAGSFTLQPGVTAP